MCRDTMVIIPVSVVVVAALAVAAYPEDWSGHPKRRNVYTSILYSTEYRNDDDNDCKLTMLC